jgi:hypothetical protein
MTLDIKAVRTNERVGPDAKLRSRQFAIQTFIARKSWILNASFFVLWDDKIAGLLYDSSATLPSRIGASIAVGQEARVW